MSQLLIQHYLNDLSDLRRVSGSQRESVVREAFKTLLKDWGRSEGLLFIPEYEHHRSAAPNRRCAPHHAFVKARSDLNHF